MPRVRKPKAARSAAPTVVAELPRAVAAPSPPGVPILVWLDQETYAAFRAGLGGTNAVGTVCRSAPAGLRLRQWKMAAPKTAPCCSITPVAYAVRLRGMTLSGAIPPQKSAHMAIKTARFSIAVSRR